jgi:hypothetical protein
MSYSKPYPQDKLDIAILMLVIIPIDNFMLLTVSFLGINVVIERDN